jgi:hypothetical protein
MGPAYAVRLAASFVAAAKKQASCPQSCWLAEVTVGSERVVHSSILVRYLFEAEFDVKEVLIGSHSVLLVLSISCSLLSEIARGTPTLTLSIEGNMTRDNQSTAGILETGRN